MDPKMLTQMVAFLSQKAITPELAHMLRPWEMVLGGLVLPVLSELDPKVKESPKFEALMKKYDREAVEAFFTEKVVEKIVPTVVEKIKEVPTVVEKLVPVDGGRTPTLHEPMEAGGKFRRLKGSVNKIARKKHGLTPAARDAINRWWNANQKLTDPGDCQPVVDEINRTNSLALSPSQVGGWVSLLCRFVTKMGDDQRATQLASMARRALFTVVPQYSDHLLAEIRANHAAQLQDKAVRKVAKAKMAAEVQRNLGTAPQPTVPPTVSRLDAAPTAPAVEELVQDAPASVEPAGINLGDITFG
jgi:hypothetical protein